MNLRPVFAALVSLGVAAAMLAGAPAGAQSPEAPASSAPPTAAAAGAPGPPGPPVREMKSLGRDRYQIGRIVVDKKARRFTVPGRVHVLGKPLEYLATSPGGRKEYETLLELDASGSEFNLACILLGLERDPRQGVYYQFSEEPLSGPRVNMRVGWQDGGKRREISAAEALLDAKQDVRPESIEWVYMGSLVNQADGQFAADITGTLAGFVHDPNSIIESVKGLGIGTYGTVAGNAAVLPPEGSPIELIVEVPRDGGRPAKP